ncbi:hypothetical protein UCREL1_1764 [Eutypa lata UCREL1]|uniref:LysM domain-containing protein n=1 Tax=Eutypa lata (strain UCR-EL1) TaxID=1287681 RepID=M7T2W9_EUTLA|nr:hypothetical protein UCREL1_1764 [Eutypa lata UCREL1]
MGRWSRYDTDEERLPEGMKRIGYDADTETYSYRDADGSIWEGAPGNQYGHLTRVSGPPTSSAPPDYDDDDNEEVSVRMPLSYDNSNDYTQKPSWRHEMMPLLNFLVLIGLFLIAVFWFLGSSGSKHPEPAACSDQTVPHKIVTGDTCWSIAEANHLSVDSLLQENEGLNCDALSIGGTVCVPKT